MSRSRIYKLMIAFVVLALFLIGCSAADVQEATQDEEVKAVVKEALIEGLADDEVKEALKVPIREALAEEAEMAEEDAEAGSRLRGSAPAAELAPAVGDILVYDADPWSKIKVISVDDSGFGFEFCNDPDCASSGGGGSLSMAFDGDAIMSVDEAMTSDRIPDDMKQALGLVSSEEQATEGADDTAEADETAAEEQATEGAEEGGEEATQEEATEGGEDASEEGASEDSDEGASSDDSAAQPVAGCEPLPGISAELAELHNQVNNYRAGLGLPCLKMSDKLNNAAQVQVDYLAQNNLLTHEGHDGTAKTTICDRQFDAGYYGAPPNENAMQGSETAKSALEGWQQSSGHNATLTDNNGKYLFTGVAVATSSNGTKYWVQTFNAQPDNGLSQRKMAQTCGGLDPDDPTKFYREHVYDALMDNFLDNCKPERSEAVPPAGDGFSVCDTVLVVDRGIEYEGLILNYIDGKYEFGFVDPADNVTYSFDVTSTDMKKK